MGKFTILSLSVDIWIVLYIHFLKACPELNPSLFTKMLWCSGPFPL